MEVLSIGEKVHILEKRTFAEQPRRHFVGQVMCATANALRIRGFTWIYERVSARYVRRPGIRERVFYPDSNLVINILPSNVDVDRIQYVTTDDGGRQITDGSRFSLDLNEMVGS